MGALSPNGMETNNANPNGNDTEPSSTVRPTHLALKTKRYSASPTTDTENQPSVASANVPDKKAWFGGDRDMIGRNDDDDDNEELENEMMEGTRCPICLMSFVGGERVGDLPCRHVFHVDCLKLWLRRKNQCPLCNFSGIAQACKAPPEGPMEAGAQESNEQIPEGEEEPNEQTAREELQQEEQLQDEEEDGHDDNGDGPTRGNN